VPIYEYLCESCGRIQEHFQKVSDPPLEKCPECEGRTARVMSRTTFHLKGGGWYKDLYGTPAPKSGGAKKESEGSSGGSGASGSSSSE
jgi:putative FmdB family regulatory protein